MVALEPPVPMPRARRPPLIRSAVVAIFASSAAFGSVLALTNARTSCDRSYVKPELTVFVETLT